MLKQWNKAKENLANRVSRTSFLENELNRNAQELERMRGSMIASCMSQE